METILVKVTVDPEFILGTMGIRRENTLDGKPVTIHAQIHTHLYLQANEYSQSAYWCFEEEESRRTGPANTTLPNVHSPVGCNSTYIVERGILKSSKLLKIHVKETPFFNCLFQKWAFFNSHFRQLIKPFKSSSLQVYSYLFKT